MRLTGWRGISSLPRGRSVGRGSAPDEPPLGSQVGRKYLIEIAGDGLNAKVAVVAARGIESSIELEPDPLHFAA